MKTTVLISAFFILSATTANATVYNIQQGLIGHWSFDDCTATDSSPQQKHGVLHSSNSEGIVCVQGIKGKALQLNIVESDNGSGKPGGNYITLPAFDNSFVAGFSGCAWAKFTESNRFFERIFDFGNGPQIDNIFLSRKDTSNYLTGWVVKSGKIFQVISKGNSDIKNNIFQHYCISIDNTTGTGSLYINGRLNSSANGLFIPNVTRTSNYIGHSNWPMNDPDFKGILDEVSIWERPLTSREILQVYNSETPLVGTINGSSLYKITCTNTDTGQSVSTIGQVGKNWSCSDLGLNLGLKQRFNITIEGTAD